GGEDHQPLVSNAGVDGFLSPILLLGDRITNIPNHSLATPKSVAYGTSLPFWVNEREQLAYAPYASSLSGLRGISNLEHKQIGAVPVPLDSVVGPASYRVSERRMRIQQERDGIAFGVRPNQPNNISR